MGEALNNIDRCIFFGTPVSLYFVHILLISFLYVARYLDVTLTVIIVVPLGRIALVIYHNVILKYHSSL